ncbi:MAG: hypothetical protein QXT10_02885 [Candidatus Bathyarchaeia archaeon]
MNGEADTRTFERFLTLFLLGFTIILVGMMLLVAATLLLGNGKASVGGVIFIWFFPIVFGVGPEAHWLVLFAVVLAVLGLVMLFIMWKAAKRREF